MRARFYKFLVVSVFCTLFYLPALAKHESGHALTDDDWATVRGNVELLDGINFMPILLPVIMKNRDTLQLTAEQVEHFRDWRKNNYVDMVNLMNGIVEQRLAFKKAALNQHTPSDELLVMQKQVLSMQEELLRLKLSCRDVLMDSITEEQWENFVFIVSDDPKLAGFIQ